MFRQVLWKEWHEQRWKLIFGTVMLLFFTGTLMAARVTTDHEIYIAICLMGGMLLSLYSAMGTFAPEISDGTQIFLFTKPVQPWKIFTSKLLMGWLNFAVPIMVCVSAISLIIFCRLENQWAELKFIARGTITGIGIGTMLYSMSCCFAPRKSGEAIVGVTGLLLFLTFVLHLLFIESIISASRDNLVFQVIFQVIPKETIEYVNPMMWTELIDSSDLNWHVWLLVFEQTIVFIFTIIFGYHKWKRG